MLRFLVKNIIIAAYNILSHNSEYRLIMNGYGQLSVKQAAKRESNRAYNAGWGVKCISEDVVF